MTGIRRFGEGAVLVELGQAIDADLSARVNALASAVRDLDYPGLGEPVPAYASLLVPFDPLLTDVERLNDRLHSLAAVLDVPHDHVEAHGLIEVPTRYGGPHGPDLATVAAAHDLREADVIALHASVEYVVHFVGFSPGFAYLGTVPEAIATPRHERPRERVAAGSVGIADRQTGVYPGGTPGGWQLIGRTDVIVWDARRQPPALFEPGAHVRFVPVGD